MLVGYSKLSYLRSLVVRMPCLTVVMILAPLYFAKISSPFREPSSFICSAKMYSKYLRGNVVSIKYFQPDGSREVEPFYKLKFPDWYTRGQRTRRDP